MRGIRIFYRLTQKNESAPYDRIILARLIAVTLFTVSVAQPSLAQRIQEGHARTVQDGVFTLMQSERGQRDYQSFCQGCHGVDLRGANARALSGEDFLRNWRGLTLDDLFDRFQTMPPSANIRVSKDTYLDILSFVLNTNGFPAGERNLTAETLGSVLMQGTEGPQAVPNYSLVQVVGCLTRGPDNTWLVTEATEPIRTRDPNASTGQARDTANLLSDGYTSFQLLYVFPSPEVMEGHRVEAKGFLIRGNQDALNVTSVSMLTPACR